MKRLLCLVSIVVLTGVVALTGCEKPPEETPLPSHLAVVFAKQPAGGQNVSSLSCTYIVEYMYSGHQEGSQWYDDGGQKRLAPKYVDLDVSWLNDKGSSYNEQSFRFSTDPKDSKSGSFTTAFNAKSGMVLDKTFWVQFSWYDSEGQHDGASNKAVCTAR